MEKKESAFGLDTFFETKHTYSKAKQIISDRIDQMEMLGSVVVVVSFCLLWLFLVTRAPVAAAAIRIQWMHAVCSDILERRYRLDVDWLASVHIYMCYFVYIT